MRAIIFTALLLISTVAQAATISVTVPNPVVPKLQDMCEELRQELRIRTADWSNELCATLFLRIGSRVYVNRVERRDQQQIIDAAVQAEIDLFDTNWPLPFTKAICGDDTLDTEFGEECDYGNTTPGDGCDQRCRIEP